jgi:uncharacterized protein (TIGR03435 family)
MRKIAVLLVLLAADMTGTMPVRSQTAQKPAFEVASIKPNRSGQQRAAIPVAFLPGGRFTATNATLVDVIVQVYPTRRVQMQGGPDWIDSERFDIVAKAPDPGQQVDLDQMRQMVQALLEDRFQLKLHIEKKEMPVYALVRGKDAPKLQSPQPGEEIGAVPGEAGKLAFTRMSMVGLVNTVSNILRVPVMDRTGLTGSYNFALDIGRFMPPPAGNGPQRADVFAIGNAISSAIEEQLGLKMEQHKELLDITIIHHAERPSEN